MVASKSSLHHVIVLIAALTPGIGFAQEDLDETIIVDDGLPHVFTDTTDQLIIRNGSRVTVTGTVTGDLADNQTTVILEDSSTASIEGGNLTGQFGLAAAGSSIVSMSSGTIEVNFEFVGGVELSDDAQFELSDGLIDVSGRTNASGIGMGGRSSANVTGGSISGRAEGTTHAIVAFDSATATIASGSFELRFPRSQGTSTFIDVKDQAMVRVSGGDFSMAGATGWGRGRLVETDENGRIEIDGGQFSIEAMNGPMMDVVGFIARGESHVVIRGGTFRLRAQSDTFLGDDEVTVVGILGQGNSRTDVLGGTFELAGESSQLTMHHLEARENSAIIVHGSGFNYAMFKPIEDIAGTIEGTLTDGTSIAYDFERDVSSVIMLVPEPYSLTLHLAIVVFVCRQSWK